MSTKAKKLTEQEVEDWLRERLESGSIGAEEIPRLMARYALTDAQEMRLEFVERMGAEEE